MDPNTAAAVSAYASAGAAILAAIALVVSARLSLRAARAAELSAKKAEEGAATARTQTAIALRSVKVAEQAVQASLRSVDISSDQLRISRQEYDRAEAPQFGRESAWVDLDVGMIYVPFVYLGGPSSVLEVSLKLIAFTFSPTGEERAHKNNFEFAMTKGFKERFWIQLDTRELLREALRLSDIYIFVKCTESEVPEDARRHWSDRWIVSIRGYATDEDIE